MERPSWLRASEEKEFSKADLQTVLDNLYERQRDVRNRAERETTFADQKFLEGLYGGISDGISQINRLYYRKG